MLSISLYRQESSFHEIFSGEAVGWVLLTATPSCRVRERHSFLCHGRVTGATIANCHTIVSRVLSSRPSPAQNGCLEEEDGEGRRREEEAESGVTGEHH